MKVYPSKRTVVFNGIKQHHADIEMKKNLMAFSFPKYRLPQDFLSLLIAKGMKPNWKGFKWCKQIMYAQNLKQFITSKQKNSVIDTVRKRIGWDVSSIIEEL